MGSVCEEETQLLPRASSQEAEGKDRWAESGGGTWHRGGWGALGESGRALPSKPGQAAGQHGTAGRSLGCWSRCESWSWTRLVAGQERASPAINTGDSASLGGHASGPL